MLECFRKPAFGIFELDKTHVYICIVVKWLRGEIAVVEHRICFYNDANERQIGQLPVTLDYAITACWFSLYYTVKMSSLE